MGMQGTPCWFELDTTDLDASTAFYGQILGWQVADSGMPDADYRLASAPDGAMVAGLSSTDEQEQASPKWVVYFAVDDADATAGDVADRGGQTIVEPTDIPGTGRFAILTDPQGVAFGVLQPLPMEDGSQGGRAFDMEAPGHGGWIELMTTDRRLAATSMPTSSAGPRASPWTWVTWAPTSCSPTTATTSAA